VTQSPSAEVTICKKELVSDDDIKQELIHVKEEKVFSSDFGTNGHNLLESPHFTGTSLCNPKEECVEITPMSNRDCMNELPDSDENVSVENEEGAIILSDNPTWTCLIQCEICQKAVRCIRIHVKNHHAMSAQSYRSQFPIVRYQRKTHHRSEAFFFTANLRTKRVSYLLRGCASMRRLHSSFNTYMMGTSVLDRDPSGSELFGL